MALACPRVCRRCRASGRPSMVALSSAGHGGDGTNPTPRRQAHDATTPEDQGSNGATTRIPSGAQPADGHQPRVPLRRGPPTAGPPSPFRRNRQDTVFITPPVADTPSTTPYASTAQASSTSQRAGGGRRKSEYRPRSAMSLARRRMIAKYLPFRWQQPLRRQAEDIPEQQFNYLLSTIVILGTGLLSGCAAYLVWPYARSLIIFLFAADAVEARVLQELTFETQYLGAISLVTAILLGNTFGFSFDRQRQIIQEISEEIFALELLLQELFMEIEEPHLRWRIIKHIKRYIDDEVQARGIDSPFRVNGAIMGIFNGLISLKEEGKDISKMIASVELLAQANSRRGAVAAALLPPLHWVMLGGLVVLLLTAFLLFDSDFQQPVGENRIIFSVLTAMLVTILQVLRDISAPDDGLYTVRDSTETRLSYVRWQMDNILNDPAIKVSILGKENDDGAGDARKEQGKPNTAYDGPSWMEE